MGQPGHALQGFRQRFTSQLPRSAETELMDAPIQDQAELAENLRDIRRVNQLLGGTSTILRHLPALLVDIPDDQPVTILDLATGSADIPLAISRWAKRRGRTMTIIASDASDGMLDIAESHIANDQSITLVNYDARQVPLPEDHVDIALCSLSLHHFGPDDVVRVLQEMDRVARVGFILNDLYRSRLGYAAAWMASRVTTRNRLTRNDAPLSVCRAYTPRELGHLMHRAGITDATISTHLWFRMAAVRKETSHHA